MSSGFGTLARPVPSVPLGATGVLGVLLVALPGAMLAVALLVERPDLVALDFTSPLRTLAFVALAAALGLLALLSPSAPVILLVAFAYANLSQVLVRNHGLPSVLQLVVIPLALAVVVRRPSMSPRYPVALTAMLALHVLMSVLSTTVARDAALADAQAIESAKGFVLYLLVVGLAATPALLWRGAWTLLASASVLAALGLYQAVTGQYDFEFGGLAQIKRAHVYGDVFEPRIAGPLGDPNFFAQMLLVALPVGLALAWWTRPRLARAAALAGCALVLAAIVLTYSRGAALALGVVLLLSCVWGGRVLRRAALAAVLLAVLVPSDFSRRLTTVWQVLPGESAVLEPDSSIEERKLVTAVAWRMFVAHWTTGVGTGNYTRYFHEHAGDVGSESREYDEPGKEYYPHNLYLEVAAETGLVGLAIFVGALAVAALTLRDAHARYRGVNPGLAALTTATAIALTAYLVTALFLHGAFQRHFWLLLGFCGALSGIASTLGVPPRSASRSLRPAPAPAADPTGMPIPAAEPLPRVAPRVRREIAVIVSRFPLITETFILREIGELERQGQPIRLAPLIEERGSVVHENARPWMARALYTPWLSASIVAANVTTFCRRPLRYAAVMTRVLGSSARHPTVLVRTAALMPKAVYLAAVFERDGIRHVHAHFATYPATVAYVVARLTGITYSMTVHGHDVLVPWRRALLDAKIRNAAFVRAISAFNRAVLEREYGNASAGRVRVVHVGVETPRQAESRSESSGPARLVCVAALEPYKGIPVLLDACSRLRDLGVAFACDLIGDGSRRSEIQSHVRRLDLDRQVHLHGALPEDAVARHVARADVAVLPSVVAPDGQMEGIPVFLMEAMAAGRPVVASRLSGIPELVEDQVTGLLVEPGDAAGLAAAIRRLLAEPRFADALAARARAKVEDEFRLDGVARRLVELFDPHNPPRADLDPSTVASLTRAGLPTDRLGVRARRDSADATVVSLVVGRRRPEPDVVVKIHRSRIGESAPPPARARREFDALTRLTGRLESHGDFHVPAPVALDESAATLVLTRCDGESLEAGIRRFRRWRTRTARARLTETMSAAGRWLRAFQTETSSALAVGGAMAALEARLLTLVDETRGTLGAGAADRIATGVTSMLRDADTSALTVGACHGDFWPGNILRSGRAITVLDFEGIHDGLALEDPAYLVVHTDLYFWRPGHARDRAGLTAAFLHGFARPRPEPVWRLCKLAAVLRALAQVERQAGATRKWRLRSLRRLAREAVQP